MSDIISSVAGSIKNWWVFIVLGILLVLASFWMFNTPVESFVGLVTFFSALIFISGLLSVFFAFTNKEDIENFGLFLAGGILDVVIGFILLKYPGITVVLFSLFVGFWLLFRGISIISLSFRIKNQNEANWIWVLIFGILVVVFALLAIVNPLIGASYLVYTLSFSILLLGLANIFIGWKLRKVKVSVKKLKQE